MKVILIAILAVGSVCQAGTLSCELLYADDGKVRRDSGSIDVDEKSESDGLELSIDGLVEVTIFRGSNGKISANMYRIDGESNYVLGDGNLLHFTAENEKDGRALTCSYR